MPKTGLDDFFAAGGKELDLLTDHVQDGLPAPTENGISKVSQATMLTELAQAEAALFTEEGTDDTYATVTSDDLHITLRLDGKGFRRWLSRRFWEEYAKAPGGQAIKDALTTLAGVAVYDGPAHPVFVRIGRFDDAVYLDLGTATWEAVRISADGWKVLSSRAVPVKFHRPEGLLPLPLPDPTGDLGLLRSFTDRKEVEGGSNKEGGGENEEAPDQSAPDANTARLMLATGFLIGLFQPAGGRVVLELLGEAGSGKTRLAHLLRAIVDPNKAPLRAMPRDERDLVIAARHGIICAFDNASELREAMSDALCRLTTGAGISTRELYSDADEVILNAQRPVLLTGISSVVTRGDLGSRTITLDLPQLDSGDRRTEADIDQAFAEAHSALLGGLLTAVATALKHQGSVHLDTLPRLADFVKWVEAAGPALGWESGAFASVFEATRRESDVMAIEALSIGPVLRRFIEKRHDWTGTASELLAELRKESTEDERKERGWPKGANALSAQLRRLSPHLRHVGIDVTRKRSGTERSLTLYLNSSGQDRQDRHDGQADHKDPPEHADPGSDSGHHEDRPPDRHPEAQGPSQLALPSALSPAVTKTADQEDPRNDTDSRPHLGGGHRTGDDGDDGDDLQRTTSRVHPGDARPLFQPPVLCESTELCRVSGACCFPGLCRTTGVMSESGCAHPHPETSRTRPATTS